MIKKFSDGFRKRINHTGTGRNGTATASAAEEQRTALDSLAFVAQQQQFAVDQEQRQQRQIQQDLDQQQQFRQQQSQQQQERLQQFQQQEQQLQERLRQQ